MNWYRPPMTRPTMALPPEDAPGHGVVSLRGVRAFFLKRVRGDEVDDLVQDVAVRMQGRQTEDAIAHPQGYLFQVARSVLADRSRRDAVRMRDSHDSLEDLHHPVEDLSPERVLLGKESLARVLDAMTMLPDRTRQAFVLHRFEEMSHRAIAEHMGISVSAVEKHVMKAMRRLAETVEN